MVKYGYDHQQEFIVFSPVQTTEEALVAIKTCKPGSSPEERAKFLQEAGELVL